MSTDLGTAVVGFQADTSGFVGGFGIVRTLLGSLPGLALAGTAAVVGLGVASVKMAADFQGGLTSLVTGAGESAKNIEMVGQGILGMSVSTATSTKQLTDGMFMIESAGYRGAEGLAVLKNAAMGAKVGNADLGVVADATTTIMRDYSISAGNSSQAVNALIATVQNGKTHMQDLASSLSQILPTSSAARVGLTDVMGAMATMTGEGVPAAQAATYLRQTIMGLEAPGKAARKAMEDVGLSSSQVAMEMQRSLPGALKMITDAVGKKFPEGSVEYVQAIKNISGGTKTMQGMLDLTGTHMKDFQSNVQNVSAAVKQGGTSILGWSVVQQDFSFQMEQMKAAVNVFMISIGTAFLPVLTKLLGTVTPLIVAFTNWVVQSGILANVSGTLVNALDAVQQATVIVSAYVSGIATPVFGALSPIIAINASHFTTLTSTLNSQATPAFHTLATVASGEVNSSLKGLQPVIVNLAQGFGVTMVKANDALLAAWQKTVNFSQGPLMNALKATSDWMQSTGTSTYTSFAHVVSDVLGGSFLQAGQDSLKMLGDISQVMAELPAKLKGINLSESLKFSISVSGGVSNPFASMLAPIQKSMGDIVKAIQTILGPIAGWMNTNVVQPIIAEWQQMITDLQPFFGQFGQFWNTTMSPILDQMGLKFHTLGDTLGGKGGVQGGFKGVLDIIRQVVEIVVKLGLMITELVLPALGWLVNEILDLTNDLATMLPKMHDFQNTLQNIVNILNPSLGAFQQISNLIRIIGDGFNWAGTQMHNFVKDFSNIPIIGGLLHDFGLDSYPSDKQKAIDWYQSHFSPAVPGTPQQPGLPIDYRRHASGGIIAPYTYGTAGEEGTELLYGGSSGISVMDASRTASLGGGGGDIHNYFIVDGEQLAYKIMTRADQMARAKYGPRGRQ